MRRARSTFACALLLCSFAFGSLAPLGSTAEAKTKETAKESSFAKLQLLRPWEVKRLTGVQQLNYYHSLQTLVTTIENATGAKDPGRYAFTSLFFDEAQAAVKFGEDCLIGGYISKWYKKPNGQLSCGVPPDEQIFDMPRGKKSFFCDSGKKGPRKAYCNSAVFLYAGDSGERFCQPLRNFSQNCQKAFEQRYGQSGDPAFPERLTRDAEKFSKTMNQKSLEDYFSDFDKYLNGIIQAGDFDAKSAEIIRKQLETIQKSRTAANTAAGNNGAGGLNGGAAPSTNPTAAGGATGQLGAAAAANANVTVNSGDDDNAPFVPSDPNPGTDLSTENDPTRENPEGGGDEDGEAKGEESKLLGKELSCVRDGLTKIGYKPSERYIALIASGLQAANGGYDTNQVAAKESLRTRVISTIQAYGFCDEASYPSSKMKPKDLQLVRRWITADGGKAQAKTGVAYFQQTTDPQTATTAARSFFDAFGLRSSIADSKASDPLTSSVEDALSQLFVKPEKTWSTLSLADRQKSISAWEKVKSGTEFEKCAADATEKRKSDDAFRLQDLRLPPAGKDGKRPTLTDEKKAEMTKISQANRKMCEAMASACSLDVAKACAGESAQAPASSAPPAAKAGTSKTPTGPSRTTK